MNKDNPNKEHDEVILNKKEDCPFVIRASKLNHKISLFRRQKQAGTNLLFPTRLSGLVTIFFLRHFRNLTRPYLICMNTILAYILNSK